MAIFYDGLWKLMEDKKVLQKDFAKNCGIAPNSITRMRQGEFVSMETLDRVCNYLDCDYGDIISRKASTETSIIQLSKMEKLGKVLKRYMSDKELSIFAVQMETMLSVNTIKTILKGKEVSLITISKLLNLGKEFQDMLAEEIEIEVEPAKKCEVQFIPAKPSKTISYKVFYKLLQCVPAGMLTRYDDIEKIVAKKLQVDYVFFDLDFDTIQWKRRAEILPTIPFWREVSTRGVLLDTMDCHLETQKEKLMQEGHTFIPYREHSFRVENYKDKLYDFERAVNIDYNEIFNN